MVEPLVTIEVASNDEEAGLLANHDSPAKQNFYEEDSVSDHQDVLLGLRESVIDIESQDRSSREFNLNLS